MIKRVRSINWVQIILTVVTTLVGLLFAGSEDFSFIFEAIRDNPQVVLIGLAAAALYTLMRVTPMVVDELLSFGQKVTATLEELRKDNERKDKNFIQAIQDLQVHVQQRTEAETRADDLSAQNKLHQINNERITDALTQALTLIQTLSEDNTQKSTELGRVSGQFSMLEKRLERELGQLKNELTLSRQRESDALKSITQYEQKEREWAQERDELNEKLNKALKELDEERTLRQNLEKRVEQLEAQKEKIAHEKTTT